MERRAAEALAGLGLLALQPVVRELLRRRNLLVRVRLVQVLADLGPAVAPELRRELARLLEQVAAGDRSGLLARACVAAVAARRQDDGGGSGPAPGACSPGTG
jgi:HEAT repeat protein